MKKILILISLLICTSLLFVGCRGALKAVGSDLKKSAENLVTEAAANVNSDTSSDAVTDGTKAVDDTEAFDAKDGDNNTEGVNSGKFECISDISDYWTDIYNQNEEAINNYGGMPIMELVTPGLCFVTGVQYDILNVYKKDGRFEGNLMLAGYPGFVEKKGSQITFGYEATIEEDAQYSDTLAGDKKAENGNCDLAKGYYYSESYTDRGGKKIDRSTDEFALQSDASMCTLVIEGKTYGLNNEEDPTTTYIFIRGGKGLYDYAIAQSTKGCDFEDLHLENDMTKEAAIAMFEKAGATIQNSGGIKDGTFYVD